MPNISQLDYSLYIARQSAKSKTIKSSATPDMPEWKLHQEILDECRRRGWIAIHARMDKPTTTPLGTPDFVVIADGGRVLLIEAKSKTGKFTMPQMALRAVLNKLGHELHIIRSVIEFYQIAGRSV